MKKQVLNVAGLTAGDAGARFVGFLATVYLARILAPSAFGLISIGLALLGQLSLLASPGIQVIESRNVAAGAVQVRERAGTVMGLRLLLAAGLWCATALVLFVVPAFFTIRVLLVWFAASLLPMAAMADWYFQGKEKGVLVGAGRFIQNAVYAVCLLALVHSAGDLLNVPVSLFIGHTVAAAALLGAFVVAEGMPRLRWDPAGWRTVFMQNAPVGLAVAMGQLVINYPPIAIGWFLSTAEAGLWGAAMKLVFLVLMLDRVLNAALLPPMTRILARQQDDGEDFVRLVFRIVAAGILPLTYLGVVFAPLAVVLIFGAQYAGASWMLSVLMAYVVLTLLNSVFVCALVGGGKERDYSLRMMLGSAVLVIAVTVLTPLAGVAGAVAGVLVGEVSTLGLMIAATRSKLRIRIAPVQVDIVIGVMVLVVAFLSFRDPLLQGGAGLGGYLLVLGVFRSFPLTALREFRQRLA